MSRSGEPFSRGEILKEVWGYTPERHVDTRVVDVHISRLRSKLEADPAPETILPATLLAVAAELAAVSTIEVTAEFLLYQITNLLIALGLLIFCAVSFPIYLPSKGAISTIR